MRRTVVPGVWSWSRWQSDRDLDFNGFFSEDADGNLVVDPIEPDAATLAALRERGVATIIVTNRDHERAAAAVAAATGARIVASEAEAPLLACPVGATVRPGERVHGWLVVGLDGCKTAGEIALVDRRRAVALVGDVVWGTPAGALTLMPDAKLADPERALLALRALRGERIEHLLVGDGACIFGGARAALGAVIDARPGILAGRVNVDELPYVGRAGAPPPFSATWAEVGGRLGAERLGYGAVRLARGDAFCPYHWHTREEELFVVLEGTPTLRTPAGTFVLRRGDCVAFRTEPAGAHRISNEHDEPALVLAIANTDPGDVCSYPDSQKFVVEATDLMVRDRPGLDYFDGES